MIHYIITDAEGKTVQSGSCQFKEELVYREGCTTTIVQKNDSRLRPPKKETEYGQSRLMDYPTFGEQLGALWKVLDSMGALDKHPEARAIYDKITAVKEKHPKK